MSHDHDHTLDPSLQYDIVLTSIENIFVYTTPYKPIQDTVAKRRSRYGEGVHRSVYDALCLSYVAVYLDVVALQYKQLICRSELNTMAPNCISVRGLVDNSNKTDDIACDTNCILLLRIKYY